MVVLGSSLNWRVPTTPLEFGSIAIGFRGRGHVGDYADSRRGDDSGITGITQSREVAY